MQGREEMDSGVLLHPGQGLFTKHQCSALPESPPHPVFLMAELEMVAQEVELVQRGPVVQPEFSKS